MKIFTNNNKEKRITNLLITFFIINLSGCSISPIAPNPDVQEPSIPGTVSKNPVTNFSNQVKTFGINLSNDDIKMITALQQVTPSGRWATSESETPKENLENNFNQFKASLAPNGPENSNDYFVKASQFANSQNLYCRYYIDLEYYKQKQKVLLIKWDSQTREFIIIHIDGRISNYQKTDKITSSRYQVIPDNFYLAETK